MEFKSRLPPAAESGGTPQDVAAPLSRSVRPLLLLIVPPSAHPSIHPPQKPAPSFWHHPVIIHPIPFFRRRSDAHNSFRFRKDCFGASGCGATTRPNPGKPFDAFLMQPSTQNDALCATTRSQDQNRRPQMLDRWAAAGEGGVQYSQEGYVSPDTPGSGGTNASLPSERLGPNQMRRGRVCSSAGVPWHRGRFDLWQPLR
ncbi:hypothetical protein B0H63DRAFT_468992 [Podospora didyma]|uniref:Uncharacterized protein n=1 Tax=Podospora didyma TaxID=330526 RepID=A0AAE0NSY5_9PEZI|nr:hypothetical protein B0H63DRAFT_468992 [Podospora didyma]